MIETNATTRREFLIRSAGVAASAGLLHVLTTQSASATPASMQAEIDKIIGAAKAQRGRIILEIPQLVENGNTVPMVIKVESPMTQKEYVKAIHVFNEKNPQSHVISVQLSPRNGRASVATRIKLADSQQVIAIAQMSDGSFWTESADVIVTIAACLEDL